MNIKGAPVFLSSKHGQHLLLKVEAPGASAHDVEVWARAAAVPYELAGSNAVVRVGALNPGLRDDWWLVDVKCISR